MDQKQENGPAYGVVEGNIRMGDNQSPVVAASTLSLAPGGTIADVPEGGMARTGRSFLE